MEETFEEPIIELERRIEALSGVGDDETTRREREQLQEQLQSLRRTVFSRLTPWQRHSSTDPTVEDYINSLPRYRYFVVHNMITFLEVYSEMAQRGKALHEATLTILALHRWKLQKGSFPDSLEELIDPGLIRTLPLDPYRDGPLTYKKQGDDFTRASRIFAFRMAGSSARVSGAKGSRLTQPRGPRVGCGTRIRT